MCTLRAGGELLGMFAKWSFEVAPLKLIRTTVKEVCQAGRQCVSDRPWFPVDLYTCKEKYKSEMNI